jgi:cysteine desulfurase
MSSNDVEESLLLAKETSECIYLDYNGTTPINPLVLDAMMPFFTVHFGNPSSSHYYGQEPKKAIDSARRSLLHFLGKQDEPSSTIWFTGCGTESDNLAVHLAIKSSTKRHVVTTNVEHPAITECLKAMEYDGLISVTYVPVQADGGVKSQDVIDAIQENTMLVTVMLANNESGALQPIKQIAEYCRSQNILFHTDAAQACGKVDVASFCEDVDMITVVGHKIGAPKGVAALYVRDGCAGDLPENRGIMLIGGGQEGGRRGGTENVPYIVGMGKAAELALQNLDSTILHMEKLRSRLLENLVRDIGAEIQPNGPLDKRHRLPNTLSIGIPGIVSGALLNAIGHLVAASAGAACHSDGIGKVSPVLKAMNVPEEYARGTLRLSVGPSNTAEEIDRASKIIAKQVKLELEQRNNNAASY